MFTISGVIQLQLGLMCLLVNLLRHVSILYASVKKLEVAGKEVPPRQVMCTATGLGGQVSVRHLCSHMSIILSHRVGISYL